MMRAIRLAALALSLATLAFLTLVFLWVIWIEYQAFGVIRINKELLASLMHFPEGHQVLRVQEARDFRDDEFEVLVEGPTLPPIQPGEQTPTVGIEIRVTEDRSELVPKREFIGRFA